MCRFLKYDNKNEHNIKCNVEHNIPQYVVLLKKQLTYMKTYYNTWDTPDSYENISAQDWDSWQAVVWINHYFLNINIQLSNTKDICKYH